MIIVGMKGWLEDCEFYTYNVLCLYENPPLGLCFELHRGKKRQIYLMAEVILYIVVEVEKLQTLTLAFSQYNLRKEFYCAHDNFI